MKKYVLPLLLCSFILTLLIAGCGRPPATPTATEVGATEVSATEVDNTAEAPVSTLASTTPDPCLSPLIEETAQQVQRHMREFDDASTLASNVPQSQLSDSIADLQRIRREADDEPIPPCLTNLKNYQISHMNSVIETLLAFMRATDARAIDCVDIASNTEEEAVCQNIANARQQHDQYLVELARILGMTVMPASPAAGPTLTPTP